LGSFISSLGIISKSCSSLLNKKQIIFQKNHLLYF
jgi:hypothetical protein